MKRKPTEKIKLQPQNTNIHVRLNSDDIELLDSCARMNGISRSAYVRNVILSHIASQQSELAISNTEKIVRETMEKILDAKTKRETQTIRNLVNEVQRTNMMLFKIYKENHPGLDESEYQAFYGESKRDAFELSSGRKGLSSIMPNADHDTVADWMKIMLGEDTE